MNFPRLRLWLMVPFCSSLLPIPVQAHECRLLGNATEADDASLTNRYQICVGFLNEDPAQGQPGKGKSNNLDFIPIYNIDAGRSRFLRVEETKNSLYPDIVDIKATVYYLNGKVFEVPEKPKYTPADFNILGVGYGSPVALKRKGPNQGLIYWQHPITNWTQRLSEGYPSYGEAGDGFPLPNKGMYMWVVEGTLRKGQYNPVYFVEKFTCQQPLWLDRATEPGWFDCARF